MIGESVHLACSVSGRLWSVRRPKRLCGTALPAQNTMPTRAIGRESKYASPALLSASLPQGCLVVALSPTSIRASWRLKNVRSWSGASSGQRTPTTPTRSPAPVRLQDGHRHRGPVEHDALFDPAEYRQLLAADRAGGTGHRNGVDRLGGQPAAPRPVLLLRPSEMLKGRVDPPGCWLDASAVLVASNTWPTASIRRRRRGNWSICRGTPKPSSRIWEVRTGTSQE